MARFIFSMQNILNMKEKLEEQAKNNFAQANRSLQEALLMQKQCENRLEAGKQTLKEAMLENLKVGQIRRREDDVEIFRMYLRQQIIVVKQKEKEVEVAREHLNEAMKERKTFEKLKEKIQFNQHTKNSKPYHNNHKHNQYRNNFASCTFICRHLIFLILIKEVEVAREHLNEAMKERKTFEKLKEKAFEKFVAEENQKEQKEVDELVSYRYGAEKFE